MNDITREQWKDLVQQTRDKQRQKYLNGLKTPIIVKCVVCDVIIEAGHPSREHLAEEYAERSSFDNGAVGVLSFGFGCKHDTKVFIIGICEHCYDAKLATGGVLFTRSYMP